jgi:predicted Zn-dependent protease
MNKLEPPDLHHLNAADGWLNLGSHREASEEMEKITPENRSHPDVLQLRWQIYARENRWDACLVIATVLTITTPDRRLSWIHRAFSLHKLNRSQEAIDGLLTVADRFGADATIPFYLARFYCQLNKLVEARQWLGKAIEEAGSEKEQKALKIKALDEPDLEPLWKATGMA